LPAMWAGIAGFVSTTTIGSPSAVMNIAARVPVATLVPVFVATLVLVPHMLSLIDRSTRWVDGTLGELMPWHVLVVLLATQSWNAYLWLVGRHLPRPSSDADGGS
jgi:hypothetical protein